jgi:hypothetical protein
VAHRTAIRNKPRVESGLHANPIRDAKPSTGCGRYIDRLGNNRLDDRRHLAALQMGCGGTSAISHVGLNCDGVAVVHDVDELGEVVS